MTLLLDTHTLVWLDEGSKRLGQQARSAIDTAWQDGDLAVSAISFWEIATLQRKGRLEIDMELLRWRGELLGLGLREIAVGGALGIAAAELADFHGDPADRLIVATVLHLEASLCTADDAVLAWLPEDARLDARK